MAFFSSDGTKTPLFDDSMSAAIRRRVAELWGLGLGVIAAGLAAALWSYDVGDPSPFSATTQPPVNWMGAAGAIVADTSIRYLGLGAWAIVAFFAAWSVRFLMHIGEERIWARLLAAPPMLVMAPVFASTHAVYPSWPLSGTGLGGMLGDAGARGLLGLVPLQPVFGLQLLSLGLAASLAVLSATALGFTAAELGLIGRWLGRSLATVAGAGGRRAASAGRQGLVRGRDWLHEHRRRRSEVMEPAEPTGSWRTRMAEMSLRIPGVALAAGTARDMPAAHGSGDVRALRIEPRVDTGGGDEAAPRPLRAIFDRLSGVERSLGPEAAAPGLDPADLPRPPVARSDRTARKSRRAEAERQPALALGGDAEDEPYSPPPLALLQKPVNLVRHPTSDSALEENARMLETVLEDYGVRGEIMAVRPGPVVTLYELEPAPGLKASRVIGLSDDIARSMSALAARVSTVPGRSIIGIELPNAEREKVWLRDLFETTEYGDARYPLALALGKDISGAPVVVNLAKMPHLLIAGTTGSGKSVAINTMILSLLYRLGPDKCRLIMIDPKMLELSVYDNIPHLLAPVVTDPKKAIVALKWVVAEMEERYRKMSKLGVRNIDGYNARVRDAIERAEAFSRTVQTGFDDETGEPVYETETFEPEEMPFIVVVVDEMADLMMVAGKEIEACIQRLAQMARASGIHLIMATQRPSVDVITGTIKANFPTRISFQVTSKIDSRTILGEQGAEQLLGQGDMLYMAGGGRIRRVHGPFVSDEEVEEVVGHLKAIGQPDYVMAVTEGVDDEAQAAVDLKLGLAQPGDSDDELYDRAVAIVARDRKCSTSYIQRKLAIGYNKAARLVEMMETQGVVTPANAVGKREILVEER
jgi:S-DNA-T family DNA segregation ATPase FtsK/SpoIIIE